jgi:hypothetical protein
MEIKLQKDYDLIYSFFKTTTEPFDDLEWDGKILNVCLNEKLIERYNCKDLRELINQI